MGDQHITATKNKAKPTRIPHALTCSPVERQAMKGKSALPVPSEFQVHAISFKIAYFTSCHRFSRRWGKTYYVTPLTPVPTTLVSHRMSGKVPRLPTSHQVIRPLEETPVEPKTRTHHGRVGSGRTAGWRGGAGQDGTPTEQYAQGTSVPRTPQGIEETMPECRPRSTNKRNPM